MLGLFGSRTVTHKRRRRVHTFKKYKTYHVDFYGRSLEVQGYEPQALKWLVARGYDPDDIRCECEFGDTLKLRYKYRGRERIYMPDIFIRKANIIVEVKSLTTMGLKGRKKRGWSMNQAKAIACHKRGFKFCLLLLNAGGQRIPLPKNWAYMKKAECIRIMREELGVKL